MTEDNDKEQLNLLKTQLDLLSQQIESVKQTNQSKLENELFPLQSAVNDFNTKLTRNQKWYNTVFCLIGYCLLGFALFDIINLFIPPRFLNAAWELEMVRSLVERVPVPLLGMGLVLLGEKNQARRKTLSIVSLIAGVMFLLLVPLGINDSLRISQQKVGEINNQASLQLTQLAQARNQVERATTDQDIKDILTTLNLKVISDKVNTPEQIKSNLLIRIQEVENTVKLKANKTTQNLKLAIIKNAVKLIMQAMIAGVVFLLLGRKSLVMLSRVWE